MEQNPSESRNVAGEHPQLVRQLDELMDEVREPSEKFTFGLKANEM